MALPFVDAKDIVAEMPQDRKVPFFSKVFILLVVVVMIFVTNYLFFFFALSVVFGQFFLRVW